MFVKIFLFMFFIFLFTGCDYNYYPNLDKQQGIKKTKQNSYPENFRIKTLFAEKNKNLFKYQIIAEDTSKSPKYELLYFIAIKDARLRCENINKSYNQISKKFIHPERNENGKWNILFQCISKQES